MHDLETIKFRNEEYANNLKARKFFQSGPGKGVEVPKHVKDEIVDDIFEIVAFTGDKKKARKKLRKLLALWIDG